MIMAESITHADTQEVCDENPGEQNVGPSSSNSSPNEFDHSGSSCDTSTAEACSTESFEVRSPDEISGGIPKETEINEDEDEEESTSGMMDMLRQFFQRMRLGQAEKKTEQVLEEVNFDGIVKYMKSDKCKNVIVMVGAGISTSAGIPDFRSPSSGIYANLSKYNLPRPECMFDIVFFKDNPTPFFDLARELFPGKFKPTPCHYFLRLLHEKGLLQRLYTQNIDTLERVAGIPAEKVVEAHGTFYTSHCLNSSCRTEYSLEWMKEKIFAHEIPTCPRCGNTVKPDIIFFGERLPERFFQCVDEDFPECDLLIIIGTSLTVQPFAGLVDNVPSTTPRLLINNQKCGQAHPLAHMMGLDAGLDFNSETAYRDVAWLGLCDEGCQMLAETLEWGEELNQLVETEHARIDSEATDSGSKSSSSKRTDV